MIPKDDLPDLSNQRLIFRAQEELKQHPIQVLTALALTALAIGAAISGAFAPDGDDPDKPTIETVSVATPTADPEPTTTPSAAGILPDPTSAPTATGLPTVAPAATVALEETVLPTATVVPTEISITPTPTVHAPTTTPIPPSPTSQSTAAPSGFLPSGSVELPAPVLSLPGEISSVVDKTTRPSELFYMDLMAGQRYVFDLSDSSVDCNLYLEDGPFFEDATKIWGVENCDYSWTAALSGRYILLVYADGYTGATYNLNIAIG